MTKRHLVPIIPMLRLSLNNLAELYDDKVAMPMPSRCTSARWRSAKKHSVPIIPMLQLSLNNLALLYGQPRSLCRCRAAVQALAGDMGKSARSRSSRCCDFAEQSGWAVSEQGRYADAEPLLQALAGDQRKGTRSRSSRCCAIAEQSGYSLPSPRSLCRCRTAVQAIAGDKGKSTRSRSSRCRAFTEQSWRNLYRIKVATADALPIVQRTISQNSAR